MWSDARARSTPNRGTAVTAKQGEPTTNASTIQSRLYQGVIATPTQHGRIREAMRMPTECQVSGREKRHSIKPRQQQGAEEGKRKAKNKADNERPARTQKTKQTVGRAAVRVDGLCHSNTRHGTTRTCTPCHSREEQSDANSTYHYKPMEPSLRFSPLVAFVSFSLSSPCTAMAQQRCFLPSAGQVTCKL